MKKTLFWFRNDLRLHDNEALCKAIELGEVIPVYIIDTRQFEKTSLGFKKTEKIRTQFLLQTLANLKSNLQKIGGDLIVKTGIPEQILFELVTIYKANLVIASKEVTQEETSIEAELSQKLKLISVDIKFFWGSTLLHVRDLPFQIHYLPDVFTTFRKRVESNWEIRPTLAAPTQISCPVDLQPGSLPTLQDLNFEECPYHPKDTNRFVGGEDSAFDQLKTYIWDTKQIASYKNTRNGLLGKGFSSKLSPWLSLGCLSPRYVYEEIKKFETCHTANESTYWLVFELLWRDYFHFIALKFGIRLFKRCGIKHDFTKKWKRNKSFLQNWIDGSTGVPLVDACMRELKQTGYLSNRGRQIAASFLCKDLGIEWWWGAMYFESQLIDYEVCSNWGNWNYLAGIGTDPKADRYFNPVIQGEKYDPEAKFIKYWLPELSDIPAHELLQINDLTTYLDDRSEYPKSVILKSKKWHLI